MSYNFIKDFGNWAIALSLEKNLHLLKLDISGTKVNADITSLLTKNIERNENRQYLLTELQVTMVTNLLICVAQSTRERESLLATLKRR